MATPRINLIPAGYYERKKAVVAAWVTGLMLVGVLAGLLFYHQSLTAKKAELMALEQEWSARKQAVDADNAAAEEARATVADVSRKVAFVNDCFKANTAWSEVFTGIVRYSHPSVQYTNIKPTANSPAVAMKVRIPSQVVLSQYWTNLLRSPIIDKAAPSQMIGGGQLAPVGQTAEPGSEGATPMYAGGPSPMPGGPSPMPGMPMPGGPMPSGLSPIGRANVVAGESMDGTLGGDWAQQLLGPDGQPIPGLESLPASLLDQFRTPNTYEIDVNAILTKPVTLPTFGGQAAADAGQAT